MDRIILAGLNAMTGTDVSNRGERFESRIESIRKLCASTVEFYVEAVFENHRLPAHKTAENLDNSKRSFHAILNNNLQAHHIAIKYVPRLLTDEQNLNSVTARQEFLDRNMSQMWIKKMPQFSIFCLVNFFFAPILKSILKCRRFKTTEECKFSSILISGLNNGFSEIILV
ncbi:hypothetical protein AVEN_189951-1 [Araneus ventricosus]|uniref:Uncharacterized protein n=1 Tax=Araneus ventricosus TaxID=182803 RepID=A0A4Y2F275_ARAVE|nr:hypothetical protein AVEN_189951-1 [Araneus ventricosus]